MYQTNFHVFKDLIFCIPHRTFPNSPLTHCLFINIVALPAALMSFRFAPWVLDLWRLMKMPYRWT